MLTRQSLLPFILANANERFVSGVDKLLHLALEPPPASSLPCRRPSRSASISLCYPCDGRGAETFACSVFSATRDDWSCVRRSPVSSGKVTPPAPCRPPPCRRPRSASVISPSRYFSRANLSQGMTRSVRGVLASRYSRSASRECASRRASGFDAIEQGRSRATRAHACELAREISSVSLIAVFSLEKIVTHISIIPILGGAREKHVPGSMAHRCGALMEIRAQDGNVG